MKRTFTREELDALDLPDGGVQPGADNPHGRAVVHSREHWDDNRWTDTWQLVFQVPGEDALYRVYYEQASTEMQDADPWNHEDEVEADVVEPVRTVATTYTPVIDTSLQAPRFTIFSAWWDGYDSWGLGRHYADETFAKHSVASAYLEEEWALEEPEEIDEAIDKHITWERFGSKDEPCWHLLDKGTRTGVEIDTITVYGRANAQEVKEYEERRAAELAKREVSRG